MGEIYWSSERIVEQYWKKKLTRGAADGIYSHVAVHGTSETNGERGRDDGGSPAGEKGGSGGEMEKAREGACGVNWKTSFTRV